MSFISISRCLSVAGVVRYPCISPYTSRLVSRHSSMDQLRKISTATGRLLEAEESCGECGSMLSQKRKVRHLHLCRVHLPQAKSQYRARQAVSSIQTALQMGRLDQFQR